MSFLDWIFPKPKADNLAKRPDRSESGPLHFTLVPRQFDPDGDDGDLMWFGCILQDQTGSRYSYDDDRLHKLGLSIFRVAGVSRRKHELQSADFAPPAFVRLVKEDSNPYDSNAVAVWNNAERVMVGYVPKEMAPIIRQTMIDHPDSRALVIAHCLKKKTRVGLTVLFGPLNGLS
jgi:HIRAN domain-containing protein